MLFGELDNASAHQVGKIVVAMADLTPEVGIVLLVFGNDASLRSVACYPPKQFLPKARYRSATADKAGGDDGAFNSLDATHGEVLVEIEIDGADLCLGFGDLLYYFWWRGECLLDGGMQPPLVAMPDQLGTSQLKEGRDVAPKRADFDPGPAGAGPDLEQDTMVLPILPLPRVERSRLLPGPGRDGRAFSKGLLRASLCASATFSGARRRSGPSPERH